jgi:hypothetical protein
VLLAVAMPTIFAFSPGYSADDTIANVVASLIAATAAVEVVPLAAAVRGWRLFEDRPLDSLVIFAAALLSAAAAAIHFAVMKMHFEEYTLFGVFFVGTATAQLAWALWLQLRPARWLLQVGAAGNLLIAAVWAIDRIWGLPIGPDHWKPNPVGFADSVASAFEIVLALCCLALLSRSTRRSLEERQMRRDIRLPLVVFVVALTALALLSAVAVAPSVIPPAA